MQFVNLWQETPECSQHKRCAKLEVVGFSFCNVVLPVPHEVWEPHGSHFFLCKQLRKEKKNQDLVAHQLGNNPTRVMFKT